MTIPTHRENQYWIVIASLFLGLALIFGGCSADRPQVVSAELVGEETVKLNYRQGDQVMEYNQVHEHLSDMKVPRPRARQLLHTLDQQKQAWTRAQDAMDSPGPSKAQVLWLARAVYVEARSEPLYGQSLVAHVLVNRLHHPAFEDTIYEVVMAPKQVTGMATQRDVWQGKDLSGYDGGDTEWRLAVRSAYSALAMPDSLRPLSGVYHYLSPHALDSTPRWAQGETPDYRIGERFYFYRGLRAPGGKATAAAAAR
jgi:spore germination cell wall hydrolase CwlJ-like protein